MAFLDFIKNRQAGQQQSVANKSQEQKPETAQQMYTREAAQEKANGKPVREHVTADEQKIITAVRATMDKATQHLDKGAQSPAPAPSDSTGSPEAMRQKMMAQDTSAPALSPTSVRAGQPATENNTPAQSNGTPAKTQKTPEQRPQQTVQRRPPSWER